MMGLLFTLALGIFILIGAFIVFVIKNNDKFVQFSISVAFGVMTTLILGELIPETFELFKTQFSTLKSSVLIVICILLGISILRFLDFFVPDHEMEHENEKEHNHQLAHIGFVSSIALVLHNIIEGMVVYSTVTKSVQLGLLVSIGVGLHNIPMGMVIASTFYKANQNKKKTFWILLGIALSTFAGGVIMYFLAGKVISDTILAVLLGITLGMLFYIILFELLPQIIKTKEKKVTILGILLGIVILIISLLIGE